MSNDTNTREDSITLIDNASGERFDFPRLKGTLGPDLIDVRTLYAKTGMFTFDPGFTSTANCESKITFIDGDKGVLLHRGYRIEDLAMHCDFTEVAHLLIFAELPDTKQKQTFSHIISQHTMLHDQLNSFYKGFRRDAHPMAVMVGVVGALSAFYHDSTDIHNPEQRNIATYRLLAKMPTIAAMAYKYSHGHPFVYPRNDLSYTENFLHMTFSVPSAKYDVNPVVSRALDKIFVLHADHEQNASTSTVRLAGSSLANPYACIAAGIASLWGPSHGGANEAVLNMLTQIGSKEHIPEFIKRAKDKDDSFRLMGFGHRVYKNYDPRAAVLKESAYEVLAELGAENDPLLALAMELEKIALEDDYFVSKKLFPNVDFYSGIILRAMGFPTSMFTALFALARTAGWIAQWKEMIEEPSQKIGRPRQLYMGEAERAFIAIEQR